MSAVVAVWAERSSTVATAATAAMAFDGLEFGMGALLVGCLDTADTLVHEPTEEDTVEEQLVDIVHKRGGHLTKPCCNTS